MTHHGSPQRYDVFDLSSGGGAFEVVSDEEMARLRDQRDTGDTDDDDVVEVEVAHAVTAQVAAELVGLPPSSVGWLERHVAEYGSFGVGSLTENWEVRRTRDD
jgi:hypothetical protein